MKKAQKTKRKSMNTGTRPLPSADGAITLKELSAHVEDLKITPRQREFVKAALRALVIAVLQKQFKARIDI